MADALTQSTPELLPVIEADRAAAFRHAFAIGRANSIHEIAIMSGDWDDTNDVQAFARHRIEHSTPDRNAVLEEAAKVAERHAVFEEAYPATDSALWLSGYDAAVTDIVADIRSLSNMRGTDND